MGRGNHSQNLESIRSVKWKEREVTERKETGHGLPSVGSLHSPFTVDRLRSEETSQRVTPRSRPFSIVRRSFKIHNKEAEYRTQSSARLLTSDSKYFHINYYPTSRYLRLYPQMPRSIYKRWGVWQDKLERGPVPIFSHNLKLGPVSSSVGFPNVENTVV